MKLDKFLVQEKRDEIAHLYLRLRQVCREEGLGAIQWKARMCEDGTMWMQCRKPLSFETCERLLAKCGCVSKQFAHGWDEVKAPFDDLKIRRPGDGN